MKGLLVDDDTLYLDALRRALQRRGIECEIAPDAATALAVAARIAPDFALVDLKLGEASGLSLIEPLRAIRADMRILLVTGYASIATAVEAIKRGADDYLPKPVSADTLQRILLDAALATPAAPADPGDDASIESPTMIPLHRLEWEHIQQALNETGGNISATARLLGMHRRSLQRKLAKRPGPERRPPSGG
ncbi:two-component system response regulator [Lysobacteraceae bacterium NML93-0792]|nr:two-component system response regulator [Xanthomonadaceae bacterium NML93-0792]PBS16315.1 two-component system response regulator [Xanthomonadaceae bacterium NML93-0793]PBS19125.1 two-component system response regulator [Xanthomonadaceae bacterium NML93-0831]